jgi:hypothetical protein
MKIATQIQGAIHKTVREAYRAAKALPPVHEDTK